MNVSKMKIEIRKPHYLDTKEPGMVAQTQVRGDKTPFFFRLLLVSTYLLSGMAIWFFYQKFSAHS
jgi:hypothetical protein